ncbi:effector binding domain-containing protein [Chloroflexota bacterium]
MSELDVRIVRHEPMRVATVTGFGESPEPLAIEKMLAFMESRGLRFEDVRWYGFNNPNPSPGSPNYGYEVWVTVGPDVEGEGEVRIQEIPSRLYGVARCEGLETIGDVWRQLALWFEDSHYGKPAHWHQGLEQLLVPPDSPYEEYVFDLHVPLAE